MRRILRFPMAMIDGLLQALQSLQTTIDGKADAAHGHAITDVDGLETTLISKVAQSREITAGTGLSGGGDLSADRTLSVSFGTTEGTACAGNDSRLSDSRAPTAHSHELGDVTGLQAGLSAKEDAGTAAELLDTHTEAADPHPQYAMASAVETALSTKADLIDGVLPTSQLPPLAIVEFLGAIESEEEMLELIGQRGDWCIRTDLERAFFLTDDDATDVDNWQQITTPGSPVLTVNGQTGEIVLGATDVGAAAATHTHTIADVSALQNALDAKAQASRKIQAGTGLSGGGDLTADRTLSVSFGTTEGTVCAGNDSRLSDSRAPTAHTHELSDVSGLQSAIDAKAPLVSPALTGTPTATTASAVDSSTRIATTAHVQSAIRIKSSAIPGAYNLERGLANYRQSTGQCGRTISGSGFGGIDILMGPGDSIKEGLGAATYLWDTVTHRLRLKLQSRYNPPGVPGGLGFVPTLTGQGNQTSWPGVTFDCWTFSPTGWTKSDSNLGVGARMSQVQPGDTYQARFDFNGTATDALIKRLGVSRLELIYSKSTSFAGTWRWDIHSSDSFIPPGTGVYFGSAPDLSSLTVIDGIRSGIPSVTLDPLARNVIQITGPVATGKNGFVQGCIAYNGDYDCGIRLHNLANGGTQTTHYISDRNLYANFDVWGSQTGGATNAKLFVMNFITNEAANGMAPATFKANYKILIERAIACPSKPSVLLLIPFLPGAGQPALANYPGLIPVIYELADEHPDHVAVMNFQEFIGGGPRSGRVNDLGLAFDPLHLNTLGNELLAQLLFDLLTAA